MSASGLSSSNSPVKLLVLAHDAAWGGAQLSLLEILERLDRTRFEPVVVAPTPGPFVDALRRRGIRCHVGMVQRWVFFTKHFSAPTILRKPWTALRHPLLLTAVAWTSLPLRIALLAMIAHREKAALIYTNTVTVLDGAVVSRLLAIPHLWHLREGMRGNADLHFPFPTGWLPGFILRHSVRVIVNSRHLFREYFGNTTDDRVRVIANGIDPSKPACSDRHLLLPTVPSDVRLTVCCGRLTPAKGIEVYLKAMGRLSESHPDVHHLVIGDGPRDFVEQMMELARRTLGDRVHFLGHRDDARALLALANVLVSASLRESFGRTLIEAMAAGIPVVATRSGGPEEIVDDGVTGLLVEVNDEVEIARRVTEILDDPAYAHAIGVRAQKQIGYRFSLARTIQELSATFEEALKSDCSP